MTAAPHIPPPPDSDTRGQAGRAFVWPVRVYWEDTDAGGIVYYANYLKYMERARTEWLRSLGCDQTAMRTRHRIQFVVARTSVEFRRPARFDDRLEIDIRLQALRRVSIELAQHVRNAERELLCRAEVKIGCVDVESFRPRGIPLSLQQELEIEH